MEATSGVGENHSCLGEGPAAFPQFAQIPGIGEGACADQVDQDDKPPLLGQ
jgi:hypothetical protein